MACGPGEPVNRAHRIGAERLSSIRKGLDMAKIRSAAGRALDLMGGLFDVRELQERDNEHDWEFRPVDRLHEKHGVLGYYWKEGPLVNIYWDAGLPIEEIQITICHELGHHFLHSLNGLVRSDSQDEYALMEAEAEVFARELLAGQWQ